MADLANEIKNLIIEALALEGVQPDAIEIEGALFGEGLGLDSIDALEIAVALEEQYGIELDTDADLKPHFYSVATLVKLIESLRSTN